jgi:hypothetical protein
MFKKNIYLYLDDVRIPKDDRWEVVTNYDEFVAHIELNGIENYECISLDHDLGEEAMQEYYRNVATNGFIEYNNISEKTGLDCARYIVNLSMDNHIPLPKVYCHSANPVGAINIMNHINGYLKSCELKENCNMVKIEHTYRQLSSEVKTTRLAIKKGHLK